MLVAAPGHDEEVADLGGVGRCRETAQGLGHPVAGDPHALEVGADIGGQRRVEDQIRPVAGGHQGHPGTEAQAQAHQERAQDATEAEPDHPQALAVYLAAVAEPGEAGADIGDHLSDPQHVLVKVAAKGEQPVGRRDGPVAVKRKVGQEHREALPLQWGADRSEHVLGQAQPVQHHDSRRRATSRLGRVVEERNHVVGRKGRGHPAGEAETMGRRWSRECRTGQEQASGLVWCPILWPRPARRTPGTGS